MRTLENIGMHLTRAEEHGGNSGKLQLTRPWVWLTAVTIVAAVLRVIGINKGLWWDEIYFLVVTVRHPLAEILARFPGDTQHPLYSVLARLSVLAFGEHAWSLRLPAVVFGVASVPLLYLLGIAVSTRNQALLAASLLAVSYHHVWFSQNARGYTMLTFWALASTLFLLQGMRTGRRGPYAAYALASALGAYTHLTMLFVVASHVVICVGCAWRDWKSGLGLAKWRFALEAFFLTGGLTLLFYAPILTQVMNYFTHRPSSMKGVSTPRWAMLETLRGLIRGLGSEGVLVVAALVIACGAWSYFRENRLALALFVLPGAFTALGAVVSRGTMYPRFFFFLIGFAVLMLVQGLVVIPRWIVAHSPGASARNHPGLAPALSAALAAVLLVSSAYSLARNYKYPKQDFEGAIQFVDRERKTGEPVVTAGASTFPLLKYYAKPWDSVETVEQLREICRQDRPVWVIYTFPRYLESWSPPLADMIRNEFTVTQVFPGTVGDGDVFVAKSEPR
jgi:hypothetical protein